LSVSNGPGGTGILPVPFSARCSTLADRSTGEPPVPPARQSRRLCFSITIPLFERRVMLKHNLQSCVACRHAAPAAGRHGAGHVGCRGGIDPASGTRGTSRTPVYQAALDHGQSSACACLARFRGIRASRREHEGFVPEARTRIAQRFIAGDGGPTATSVPAGTAEHSGQRRPPRRPASGSIVPPGRRSLQARLAPQRFIAGLLSAVSAGHDLAP